MASSLQIQLQVLLLLLILISFFISTASISASAMSASPSLPPLPQQDHVLYSAVLTTLGFQQLATATAAANLTTTTPLQLPLVKLMVNEKNVFVNGVEITSPDLFNNGLVMVHGLQGFVSHLSPLSCNVERMTSLSFPPQSISAAASFSVMRLMLKDAILRLRNSGYSFVALALRLKFADLVEFKSITVFALDDASIFAGEGMAYLSHFRFHVLPNRRILAAELVTLPATTVLSTMENEHKLVVTTSGGGGLEAPMKINYVRITTLDLLHNSRIAVHGVSTAFPLMHHHTGDQTDDHGFEQMERSRCDPTWNGDICEVTAQVPAGAGSPDPSIDMDYHHGL